MMMQQPKQAIVYGFEAMKRWDLRQNGFNWAARDTANAIEALVERKVAEALAKEKEKARKAKPSIEYMGRILDRLERREWPQWKIEMAYQELLSRRGKVCQ